MGTDEEVLSPLEYVSRVTELNDLCDFLQDSVIDETMDLIVKLYVKDGYVPPDKVPGIIVKLQSVSAQCALKAKYYMIIEKDSSKKNIYFTLREILDKIVDSLKYVARYGS